MTGTAFVLWHGSSHAWATRASSCSGFTPWSRSWELGLAYQYAGNSRSSVQGKSSNLKLDGIMTVNTGLNYAF